MQTLFCHRALGSASPEAAWRATHGTRWQPRQGMQRLERHGVLDRPRRTGCGKTFGGISH